MAGGECWSLKERVMLYLSEGRKCRVGDVSKSMQRVTRGGAFGNLSSDTDSLLCTCMPGTTTGRD